MSKNRSRASQSKLKVMQDTEPFGIQHSVDESNDSIPFQRLESPRPPSPGNFTSLHIPTAPSNNDGMTTTDLIIGDNSSGDVESIDNDEPEPFASLDENYFDSDYEGDEDLRPPSQNSIASVIKHSFKHSFQEAKHMMHLCGVGVGANNANEFADGEIPDVYQKDLPKFHSTGTMPPYQDSIPSRTYTTSSSSLSTHFDKYGSKPCREQKEMTNTQDNAKMVPFPQSIYPSSNATSKKTEAQVPVIPNNNSIPLRHSQSVPFKSDTVQHLFMRRSASTPATFNIGKGRSAFGKVDGNTIPNRSIPYLSPNAKDSLPQTKKCMSDSKYQTRSKSMQDLKPAPEPAFDPTALPTSAKHWVSSQEAPKRASNEKEETTTEDSRNISSTDINDDVSSASGLYSKSNIMNSKTQRKIKERRKERRKLMKESNKQTNDSASTQSTDQKEQKEKGDEAFIGFETEMERMVISEPHPKIADQGPIEHNPDFSDRIVSRLNTRKVESPPVPPTLYHKMADDDHHSPSFTQANPPIPPSNDRRASKVLVSPVDRVGSPPLNHNNPSQILSPQRKRENASPCSHDSTLYSRNSRSGQSVNTSSQTISTFISCNASCNRSVTSSVAEADREVRDTNRRELKRREGLDLDGSMSIQSSDTISTNAYLALTSSPAQLREGANIHHDRFFGCNNSVGAMNSQSSNASSVGMSYNQNHSIYSPGMNSRNTAATNVRSPITVSSNSIANNTNSSTSTSEDPPRFVSCSSKVVPINYNRSNMPPRSDQYDSSVAYTKLGSSEGRCKSRSSSSRSSSSKSTKSKSSRSKSSGTKKKEKSWLYHKIGSAKIADHHGRASTPSPCNSILASPVKTPVTPPNQFDYPSELVDVQKPRVRRHFPVGNVIPGSKMVLVSPVENERRRESAPRPMNSFWPPNGREQRAFQSTVIIESVVTPEKSPQESHL